MERRKKYNESQIEQDLYQYEMGIELGAEIETAKRHHEIEYDRQHAHPDYKGEQNNPSNKQ